MRLFFTYVVCVAIASGVNLAMQELSMWFWPQILLALLVGTVGGLLTKYVLVKKYTFAFKAQDHKHEARTFLLYSFLGVFATLTFWGIELGFHYYLEFEGSRQVGAVIGLVVASYIKFLMDRDLVFVSRV